MKCINCGKDIQLSSKPPRYNWEHSDGISCGHSCEPESQPQRHLTKEEVDKYVGVHGVYCPFEDCGSRNIEGYGSFDMDANSAWQDIHCNDCGRSWTDEYSLTGVQAHEE